MTLSRSIGARDQRASLTSRRAFRARCVREWMPAYEDEGSRGSAHGAVPVDAGTWWSVSLDAPLPHEPAREALVRVRLQRHGAPASPLVHGVVELHLPLPEVDAVLAALQGVVAQARRDGVL